MLKTIIQKQGDSFKHRGYGTLVIKRTMIPDNAVFDVT